MTSRPRRAVQVTEEHYKRTKVLAEDEGITQSSWLERLLHLKLTAVGVDMGPPPNLTPARGAKKQEAEEESRQESRQSVVISGSGVNFL